MALDYDDIRKSLYDIISFIVPIYVPIIFYNPNSPRPKSPYITLYISSSVGIHQDWIDHKTSNAGIISLKGDRQFTLQIQTYGDDCFTLLELIRSSFNKPSIKDFTNSEGLAFFQSFPINDITSLVDSEFEKRAQMDLLFGAGNLYDDNVGFFEEIEIQEIIYNPLGEIVYDETRIID